MNEYKIKDKILIQILTNSKIEILDKDENYKINYVKKEDFEELFNNYLSILEKIKKDLKIDDKKAKEIFVKTNSLNIINPTIKPIIVQGIYFLKAYSLVKDKKKILNKYLDIELIRLKNKLWREFNRAKKNINNINEIKKLEELTLEKVKRYELIYYDIKKNPDKYNLIYTTLPSLREIYRPYIKFWDDGKIKKTSIRKNKINIVYKTLLKLPTKEDIVEKELNEMEGNIRNIFYKKVK